MSENNIRYSILILLLAIFCRPFPPCFAQGNGKPYIKNFPPKTYGANVQNWAALQDRRGVMFFANGEGVLEFDGTYFNLIHLPNHYAARSLAMSSDGVVFVGGVNELGFLEPTEAGNLEYISLVHKIPSGKRGFQNIQQVHAIGEKVFFRSTYAVFAYNRRAGIMSVYESRIKTTHSFILDNRYFINLKDGGIIVNEKNSVFSKVQIEGGLKNITVSASFSAAIGTQTLVTENHGLYNFSANKGNIYGFKAFETDRDQFLKKNKATSASSCKDGSLFALGFEGKGLLVFDKNGHFSRAYNTHNGLESNDVYSVCQDSHGGLWLGLNKGLARVEPGDALSHWDESTGLEGLPESICRHDNSVYVCTHQGIYRLDSGKAYKIDEGDRQCWSMLEYKDQKTENKILLAGASDGIWQVKGRKSERIDTVSTVFSMIQSTYYPERVYLGLSEGIAILDRKPNKNKWMPAKRIKGFTQNIRCILEAGNDTLWMASYRNGVYRCVLNADSSFSEIKRYGSEKGFRSLKNIMVYSIAGKIVFATEYGLMEYNPSSDSIVPEKNISGKIGGGKRDVHFVKQNPVKGETWITGTENKKHPIGLLKQSADGGTEWIQKPFKTIPEMSILSFYLEENGTAWIGGGEGLFMIQQDTAHNYKRVELEKFQVLIRHIVENEDTLIFNGAFSTPADTTLHIKRLLAANQAASEQVVFPYQLNSPAFHYSATYYDRPGFTEYTHILEGYDKHWSQWSQETKKEYTNLSGGDYVFKVKARNIYGVESEVAYYRFHIVPPWYWQSWAYSIYFMILAFIVFLAIKINEKRLRAENRKLELTIAKRTREISQKNTALQQQKEEILVQSETLKEVNEVVTHKNSVLEQQKEEMLAQAEKLKHANENISKANIELTRQKEDLQNAHERLNETHNKLVDLEHFKDSMAGMIVHDLKNPINTIVGFSSQQPENVLMRHINQAGKQMLTLVQNILDVQKFEDAEVKINKAEVNVFDLSFEALEHVELLLNEKGVIVHNKISEDIYINGDKAILVRIYENLLTNAIKYNPLRGQIWLDAESRTDGYVEMSVRDSGEGIPADKLTAVFDKYEQVKAKNSGKTQSTGLGLTFCKMVVNAHEGEIWVESQEGKGSTFHFTIPGTTKKDGEHEHRHDELSIKEKYEFTPKGKSLLRDFVCSIEGIPMYNSGKILSALEKLRKKSSEEKIHQWAADLESSVLNYDEDGFEKLVSFSTVTHGE